MAGTASAGLLVALGWATHWRAAHLWVLALLPGAGLLIGGACHYYGNGVVRGNNLIPDEIHRPGQRPGITKHPARSSGNPFQNVTAPTTRNFKSTSSPTPTGYCQTRKAPA